MKIPVQMYLKKKKALCIFISIQAKWNVWQWREISIVSQCEFQAFFCLKTALKFCTLNVQRGRNMFLHEKGQNSLKVSVLRLTSSPRNNLLTTSPLLPPPDSLSEKFRAPMIKLVSASAPQNTFIALKYTQNRHKSSSMMERTGEICLETAKQRFFCFLLSLTFENTSRESYANSSD